MPPPSPWPSTLLTPPGHGRALRHAARHARPLAACVHLAASAALAWLPAPCLRVCIFFLPTGLQDLQEAEDLQNDKDQAVQPGRATSRSRRAALQRGHPSRT